MCCCCGCETGRWCDFEGVDAAGGVANRATSRGLLPPAAWTKHWVSTEYWVINARMNHYFVNTSRARLPPAAWTQHWISTEYWIINVRLNYYLVNTSSVRLPPAAWTQHWVIQYWISAVYDDVSFYNSTASSWTLATPRTTWEYGVNNALLNHYSVLQERDCQWLHQPSTEL